MSSQRCFPARLTGVRLWPAVALALVLRLIHPLKSHAENRVEYRYEDYAEDSDRIDVRTHSAYGEYEFNPRLAVKAMFVYDSISGATPTGAPAPVPGGQVPLAEIDDIRRAGTLDLAIRYGRHTTTPQIAYSEESDYTSWGFTLNHSIDFNQKNTTLNLGIARNFDEVSGAFQPVAQDKDVWNFLVGVNQLLGPKTTFTANFTFGYQEGYLTDPYKGVLVSFEYPDPGLNISQLVPENRPDSRQQEIFYTSLTHFITPVNASIEGSYRFYHDDFGIFAHTFGLTWHQKIGERVTIAPLFRFHHQSEADFYTTQLPGDPLFPDGTKVAFQDGAFIAFEGEEAYPEDPTGYEIVTVPPLPPYFSADYRLSELNTFTYGVRVQVKVCDNFSLEGAYKRYEMIGLDNVTAESAYPSANVFTIGASIWF